jgi:hypothetical protein
MPISRKHVARYVDPTGRFGAIQELWEHYCGLSSRIERLQKELTAVRQKLLKREPSFFDTKRSLVGISFPFLPVNTGLRRSNPGIAFRNAIILRADGMKLKDICLRLDSYPGLPVPGSWSADFPEIKSWVAAYRHKLCRPRLEKLVSDVRARGRLP